MEGGKFHPHNNNKVSGLSSDKVEDKEPETEINQSDAEKLKEKKTSD